MSNSDPIGAIVVPTFVTEGLTTAVEAVQTALASKPAARDTNAAKNLRELVEALRSLGL